LLCLPGMTTAKDNPDAFSQTLVDLFSHHRGEVAAAYKHLKSGESFEHNADTPMPTASLIKLPIMATAYHMVEQDGLDLAKTVTLTEEEKVPGSGVLTTQFSPGAAFSLRDAIRLMIAYSDNTATNLVIDQIGLPATNAYMEELGLKETRLYAKVFRRDTSLDIKKSQEFGLGSTTAGEMIKLLELLQQGKLAGADACSQMTEHLLACEHTSTVPRFLPSEARVAHKTGSVSASRCDAGIIESPAGPIAYCILTTNNEDKSWGEDNEAELLAAEFGRAVYGHFNKNEDPQAPTVARVLKMGADGELVEALQRTLNALVLPSPQLSVDGDFGPNTQSAVIAFQKQEGVEATGEVGPDTWRALGPLLTEDAASPAPEEVNDQPRTKAGADPLVGPPVVTCAAYAIADRSTGKVLWGYNDAKPRDPASITKIMTAHLVCCLAEQDSSVLEDQLTFSKAADETSGSTSAVRFGERLSVLEALYGLMLPSGNDMARALAEHFGNRVSDGAAGSDKSSYDLFIDAMNAKAAELGMASTGYRNPHGLTAEGHVTTAADMVKLAHAAMQSPVFREVVKTPVRGCTLDSVDGYQRNTVWKNTNHLLGIEGFDGVKTGTTGPAGACLVASGSRDGTGLYVVVLGATSGDARYVDARNLFRWAWKELGVED
ncbi:MAG: serine hydrolase, partial [Planctomycetales bacterium]|nr:serine hydrolase [Planctomycetales bacterium]